MVMREDNGETVVGWSPLDSEDDAPDPVKTMQFDRARMPPTPPPTARLLRRAVEALLLQLAVGGPVTTTSSGGCLAALT